MKYEGNQSSIQDTENTRSALKALAYVKPPDSDVWKTQRQSFLTEVSDMQQSKVTNQHQQTPVVSHWTGLRQSIFKERSIMLIALKAVVVLTLVFGGTLGTVGASGTSVPGSTLYPIKMQLENWQLNTVKEPQRQAMLALKFAQHRMDEVEILMERGDEVPPEVAQRYQDQVTTAMQAGDSLPEPLKEQIQNRIQSMLSVHTQTMTQLRQRTCDECELDEPLKAMIQVMEQTRTKLGLQEGQDGDAPSDPPESPGKGPGNTDQGQGPGDGSGNETSPQNGEGDGTGPGEPPEDKPGADNGSGPQSEQEKPDEAGNDEAPEGEKQGPDDGAGDGMPPEDSPGNGPADNAGDGDQDGTCNAGGNCGDGEGDGNNGAGDNGGSDGGEPSGGDNSEGDNSGGDNGGSDGNGGGNGG